MLIRLISKNSCSKTTFTPKFRLGKRKSPTVIMKIILSFLLLFHVISVNAQDSVKNNGIQNLSWKNVATKMPKEWYATKEAAAVAETVLFCQKNIKHH